ncbi:MAG: hypothetical protein GY930_18945, partial [bacterium]|nr:hypothetical protein [bacterium]
MEKDQATLADATRAMLKGRSVPEKYWPLGLQTAAFLKNRTPHEALEGKLPVEVGTGETFEPCRLRTFGCAAYVQMEKGLRDGKGGDVRWNGIFVGYSPESPAWLILDPCSGRIREAYHVKFVEDKPGFDVGQGGGMPQGREITVTQPTPQTMVEACQGGLTEPEDEPEQAVGAEGERRDTDIRGSETSRGATTDPHRSTRTGAPRDLWNPSSPTTDGTEKLRRERQAYSNKALLTMAATVKCQAEEPRSWREAILSKDWLESMQREKDALKSAHAYTLVEQDAGMRVDNGIWRFRAKLDQNGEVAKLKSRYVLDGSRQWSPFGREDTYSPVAELSSIRTILACAAEKGWEVIQADFTAAYLNAKLNEPVHMQQPPGLVEGGDRMVWKLSRAIYGMKQSGKLWYDELRGTLKKLGYRPTMTDPCIFTRRNTEGRDIIAIYVDNLLVTGTGNKERLDSLISELEEFYNITNLGSMSHLLGIGIRKTKGGIYLDQEAFIRSILKEEGVLLAPRGTPWYHRSDEDVPGETLDTEETQSYRRLLGKLMYAATCTRPDISFAVSSLSRWMQEPKALHQRKLVRLCQYLSGAPVLGLLYRRESVDCKVTTYSDAALGHDRSQGRGRSGVIVKLGGAPVCWGSRVQRTVADSSQAAELLAAHEATQMTLKVNNLLEELGCKSQKPPVILEDNDGMRAMAMGDVGGKKRCRHLALKYHLVRESCEEGKVRVER